MHTLGTRIVRYLASHNSANEKEIAEALGLKEVEVLTALTELEKKGIITSFLDAEEPK